MPIVLQKKTKNKSQVLEQEAAAPATRRACTFGFADPASDATTGTFGAPVCVGT